MHRRAQILMLCCVLLTAAIAPPAVAQDGGGSPQELWEEFPLDPTPTATAPGAASPDPTPAAAAPRTPATEGSDDDDDGTATSLLVMLGVVALAGALAGVTWMRRVRSRRIVIPVRMRPVDAAPTCQVNLRAGERKSYFYAAPQDGGPELARSPSFTVRNGEEGNAEGAPEALQALVDELTADGWHKTAAGRTPWDLRFSRHASARSLESAHSR